MKIPPPFILLLSAAFLVLCDQAFPGFSIEEAGQWWLGGVVIAFGTLLDLSSVWRFFRAHTTVNPLQVDQAKTLVTDGPFRFSRNPMYLGMVIALAGLGIGLGTMVTPLVVAAFVMWMDRFQIAREEPALAKLFGDAYADYCRRVRRWI